jgi:hemin uptake protein HemP
LGSAGGRCNRVQQLAGYQLFTAQAIRSHPARLGYVAVQEPSIARAELYIDCKLRRFGLRADRTIQNADRKNLLKNLGAQQTEMATTAGNHDDESAAKTAVSPAAATRSIAMNGNRIDSRELFAAEREIIIVHGEDHYRLRLTSQNKLILTK